MKIEKYYQVIKEIGFYDETIANFETYDEASEFIALVAEANGFVETDSCDSLCGYVHKKREEYLFLNYYKTIIYEDFNEYKNSINHLNKISEMLAKEGIKSERYRDKLYVQYKFGQFFEVNGLVTKEEIYERLNRYKSA